jgi:hypothetical protein
MDSALFLESCGLGPVAFDSNHEFTDSEGSSHDEGTVNLVV